MIRDSPSGSASGGGSGTPEPKRQRLPDSEEKKQSDSDLTKARSMDNPAPRPGIIYAREADRTVILDLTTIHNMSPAMVRMTAYEIADIETRILLARRKSDSRPPSPFARYPVCHSLVGGSGSSSSSSSSGAGTVVSSGSGRVDDNAVSSLAASEYSASEYSELFAMRYKSIKRCILDELRERIENLRREASEACAESQHLQQGLRDIAVVTDIISSFD